MQKGFSLIEMLMVSLFSSLLLLALSHGLITLIKFQTEQSELLRLTERLTLAKLAIRNAVSHSRRILDSSEATSYYPVLTEQDILLNKNSPTNEVRFKQISSSDSLLLITSNSKNKTSLFHLDKKTYDFGLAYKDLSIEKPRSDTLVTHVELMRLRFLCNGQQNWVKRSEVNDFKKVNGVQFALIVTTNQPVKKTSNNSSFLLWGEVLTPPKDGHYRRIISSTVHLIKEAP